MNLNSMGEDTEVNGSGYDDSDTLCYFDMAQGNDLIVETVVKHMDDKFVSLLAAVSTGGRVPNVVPATVGRHWGTSHSQPACPGNEVSKPGSTTSTRGLPTPAPGPLDLPPMPSRLPKPLSLFCCYAAHDDDDENHN